jgi:hypothetical protein
MMPSDYVARDGTKRDFDLDSLLEIVGGYSNRRKGWTAILVYVPESGAFVEVRSSPPDVRGESDDEAEEVDASYILEAFSLSKAQLQDAISKPAAWRFIDHRKPSRP